MMTPAARSSLLCDRTSKARSSMPRRTFGTVRQLPSGRWQARYRDGAGPQKTAPITFATKADANRWLAGAQADLDRGEWFDPHAGKETLGDYAARWIDSRLVRGRPLAPRTAELYRGQLRRHLAPAFAATELRRLDATAVRTWYTNLSGPAGPGQVTAAKCYRLLRAICGTAVEDGLILKNPCAIRGAGQERGRSGRCSASPRCRPSPTRSVSGGGPRSCWPPGPACASANSRRCAGGPRSGGRDGQRHGDRRRRCR